MAETTEKKKKRVNPNKKGKRGERGLAEELTKLTGLPWRRVPHSGMLRTHLSENASDKVRQTFNGDVFCEVDYITIPFMFESKNEKSFDYHNILLGTSSTFWNRWEQAVAEVAGMPNIYPVLALHANYKPWILFSTYKGRGWFKSILADRGGGLIYVGTLADLIESMYQDFPNIMTQTVEYKKRKDLQTEV